MSECVFVDERKKGKASRMAWMDWAFYIAGAVGFEGVRDRHGSPIISRLHCW